MINNIDINKIVLSNKVLFVNQDFKYFIGYKDAKKTNPLCIFVPKMSAQRRDFGKTKCMSFMIKYETILEKCNIIWEKFSNRIKKKLKVNFYMIKKI